MKNFLSENIVKAHEKKRLDSDVDRGVYHLQTTHNAWIYQPNSGI